MSLLKFLVRSGVVTFATLTIAGVTFGEPTKIAGATSVKTIVDKAVVGFTKTKPDAQFVVGGGASGQGIKLAASGEVQIGMSARDLNEQEKKDQPMLASFPIGLDGIALVVHTDNPVKQLTSKQVCDIYTGKVTNWKNIGGKDAPIVVTTFISGTGKLDVFSAHFKLDPKPDGKMVSYKTKDGGQFGPAIGPGTDKNQDILAKVSVDPNALGYVSLGMAASVVAKGAPVKLLELDGLAATEANVQSGSYKLQNALVLLTKGQPSGLVKDFIDFMLSTEGQKLVKEAGFIPVK